MTGVLVACFEPGAELRADILIEPSADMNAVKITMGGTSRIVIGPSLIAVIERVLREAREP